MRLYLFLFCFFSWLSSPPPPFYVLFFFLLFFAFSDHQFSLIFFSYSYYSSLEKQEEEEEEEIGKDNIFSWHSSVNVKNSSRFIYQISRSPFPFLIIDFILHYVDRYVYLSSFDSSYSYFNKRGLLSII